MLLAALLGTGTLAGCSLIPGASSARRASPSAEPATPAPSTAAPSTAAASATPSTTASATAGALEGWSLEEKVASS